jgi:hypothetical protein
MNDITRQRCEDLLYILNAPDHFRKRLFCTKELVTTFAELVLNVLYGDIVISEEEKNLLVKSKSLCDKIATSKTGIDEKIKKINKLDDITLNTFAEILDRYV